jgi:hypothetical protein
VRKKKNSGQAILEYVLLLSITMGTMVFFLRTMTKSLNTSIPRIGGIFERQLRAGAAPAGLWKK